MCGSRFTQQLVPWHGPVSPSYAEPEFAAVTPLETVTFSRCVLVPSLLMIAVSTADPPGAIVSWK